MQLHQCEPQSAHAKQGKETKSLKTLSRHKDTEGGTESQKEGQWVEGKNRTDA